MALPSDARESRLRDNLARVRERIAAAARRAGRSPSDVTLVAVTKYADAATARRLALAGCRDLGEARPQELWRKAQALADIGVRWHLVGHLQRNKIARTLPLVWLIHSADSLRLLEALESQAAAAAAPVNVLLEVNISGEPAKTGLPVDDAGPLVDRLAELPHVEVRGLMTMAAREGDLDAARRDFARLRALRDALCARTGGRLALAELSMGMSGDFEAAIEEGATIVRIGSALFEGL